MGVYDDEDRRTIGVSSSDIGDPRESGGTSLRGAEMTGLVDSGLAGTGVSQRVVGSPRDRSPKTSFVKEGPPGRGWVDRRSGPKRHPGRST